MHPIENVGLLVSDRGEALGQSCVIGRGLWQRRGIHAPSPAAARPRQLPWSHPVDHDYPVGRRLLPQQSVGMRCPSGDHMRFDLGVGGAERGNDLPRDRPDNPFLGIKLPSWVPSGASTGHSQSRASRQPLVERLATDAQVRPRDARPTLSPTANRHINGAKTAAAA